MRVLLVHNKYQQYGGEDGVFKSEGELLKQHGDEVADLIFDNKEIKTILDKILSGIGSLYNFKSARRLEEKIRDFKPDVIHVHNFFPLASPSIFYVAKRKNVPIVMTLHNYRLMCPSTTLFYDGKIYEKSVGSLVPFHAIMKGVYRNSRLQTASVVAMTAIHSLLGTWKTKVNKYIALTQFSKNKFLESALGIPSNNFVVKPNFVRNDGDSKLERENFFLFVGRLSEEKGIDVLLRSAQLLSYPLIIIGDGPLRSAVEKFCDTHAHARYLAFQNKSVIMDHMKRAKGLIFCSTYYECFPLTLLEAFSVGAPVIASRLGAVKEIVQDGVNGLCFHPGNANDLVTKIVTLSENKDLAQQLSENARDTYLQNYTPEKNYAQLTAIYRELINSKRLSQGAEALKPMIETAKA
jgi:glycosyltransferase involved in cell wall biosynthesis